jgi:hypothetical protein
VSRWTQPLLLLATDPKISDARYGFSKSRRGGCQYGNPLGWGWPESPYVNCVTWVVQALACGARILGERQEVTFNDWKLGCLWDGQDKRGAVLLAHQWGLAEEPQLGFGGAVQEGQWYVCQGYRSGGGHAFFALAHDGGLVYLEANGRPTGGSVLGGLDGVGSRHAEPRNGRDWPQGNWPPSLSPAEVGAVEATYSTLWTAQLR